MKMHVQRKLFQVMLTAWLMLVAIPNVVTAGPIEDGSAAYQRHDYETALRLLRGPAEQGSAEAQLLLGFMYHDGEGVPQDYAEAARWLRKAAEQGNIAAQGALGGMYLDGLGVLRDSAQATRWLQKAAEQGLPPAQSILGGLADKAGNYVEALKWYRLAANQGDAEAQNNLGNMYETGRGVAQNYAEAAKWYRLAAGQGLAGAQYNLGILYDNGHGVTRDYEEAAKWYGLAAAQGDADAQYSLGILYDNGTGVAQDDTEAAKWFRLAADQGYAKAQNNLGALYARGHGVPRDYVQAYMWFTLSAAQGNPPAAKNRDAAAGLMTVAQIAEAQELVREWKPKSQQKVLVSPGLAQDGPSVVAGVKDVANQLELYLDYVAKTGGWPDFSKPPVSDQFARLFDLAQLTALPPSKASDAPWLIDWIGTANGAIKAILYFGIAPPVDPIADQAAIKRNVTDFEDQEAVAMSFMVRISARAMQAMFLFIDQLTPVQRTPIRLEGFTKARVGGAETLLGALVTIAQGIKPANAQLLSAAIRDTSDVWVASVLPGDRPTILGMLAKAKDASEDDETRKNLTAFDAELSNAK
jgi:uncharacterized protein